MSEKDDNTGKKPHEIWLRRLAREAKAHDDYRKRAEDARKAYDDRKHKKHFAIFWSTCEVTRAAIFAREAKPDVRKRNSNGPKEADNVATAIERALNYYQDCEGYFWEFNACVLDMLVQSLGVAKAELDTETAEIPVHDPVTQEPILGEDGEPVTEKAIIGQKIRVTYWPAKRFRWEPAANWNRVNWISFDHELTRDEIEEQFGKEIPIGKRSQDRGTRTDGLDGQKRENTFIVHEIWNKKAGTRIFVSDCYDGTLEEGPVPLKLDNFWPTPKPMTIGVEGDDFCPWPEYDKVEETCKQIELLTKRIRSLTKSIRDVGFYDASFPELGNLQNAEDGDRLAVKNLLERLNQASTNRAAWDAVVADPDNRTKVETLAKMVEQRELAKNELFETLGIADIIRGASVASETATAQQIKGQWANVRIGPKIREITRYNRDMLRICAEIICEHVDPEQLMQITGVELSPEEIQIMRSDESRQYLVDIETDATLAQDEQDEKASRTELYNAVMQHVQGTFAAVQQGQMPAELARELLNFVVSSHKHGRQLRDVIDQLPGSQEQLGQLQQQLQQGQQQAEQLQQQLQEAQQQLQQYQQAEEQRLQAETQATVTLKDAQAQKALADAANAGKPGPVDSAGNQLKMAQTRKTLAEAQKIQTETALAPQRAIADLAVKREANAFRAQNKQPTPPV